MSTSLNVVSMAAVSCASFSRLAMVWRSRVMRTRSSREASSGASGARGGAGGFGFGSRLSSASAAPAMLVTGAAGRVASTSGFNTWPRRPEPFTSCALKPASAISLRAAGDGGISSALTSSRALRLALERLRLGWRRWRAQSGLFDDCRRFRRGEAERRRLGLGLGGLGLAFASLMAPSSAPTGTVSPVFTAISDNTPEAGAGTSTVTLSVSSSTRGSAAETVSPACLNHWPTVASTMDSPKIRHPDLSRHGRRLYGFRLTKRFVEKSLQLARMLAHQSGRGRRRAWAAGITRALMLGADMVENPFKVGLDEAPSAHILGLLLAPYHLGVLEAA